MELLQQWEGVVNLIEEEQLFAELFDLTDPSQPILDAVIPLTLVDSGDRSICEPGALFYLSVTRTPENGVNVEVRFRRILWTRRDLEDMEIRKAEWRKLIMGSDES